MLSSRLIASCLLLGLAAACKKDPTNPGDNPPPPPITVGMTCGTGTGTGTGTAIPCDIKLGNSAGFRVTLVSAECKATTTVVRVTKPTETTLTVDGCHQAAGSSWDFTVPPGTAPENNVAALEITAAAERNSAQLQVEGTASPWTIRFEDGYDTDFNDIVLRIDAL